MIKFIYFGDLYEVKMSELLKDLKKIKVQAGNDLDLMKDLMSGGGGDRSAMEGLMKML